MASVKHAWIRKYGELEGLRRWREHCQSNLSATLDNCKRKYGEVLGIQKYEQHKNNCARSRTLVGYQEKYGLIDGEKRWKEKNSHLSVGINTLKRNGYSDKEILVIKKNHSEKSKITLESYVFKYGKLAGEIKWKNRIQNAKLASKRTLQYWLKVYDGNKHLAIKSLRLEQSRNLEFFISIYGKTLGTEKYETYCRNKTKNWKNKTFNYSHGQLEVEQYVRSILPNEVIFGYDDKYAIFLTLNEQQKSGIRIFYPDIIIPKLNIIIEYFGDFWHANKNMFTKNQLHPYFKQPANEIWKSDLIRIQLLRKRGYKVIIIWESNWKTEFIKTKQLLLEILNAHNKKRDCDGVHM